jgi:signal peptidase
MMMNLTYDGIDVSEGLIVSGIVLMLLAGFYLYKKGNRIIIGLIASQYKPRRAKLKKDTSGRDWLLFIVLLAMVVILGLKMVTPMVVVSDSMKPEFQRGDMIIVQSIFLTPEVGDIITFNVNNKNVDISHRVIIPEKTITAQHRKILKPKLSSLTTIRWLSRIWALFSS